MQEHKEVWEMCTDCGKVIEDAGRTACFFCDKECLLEVDLTPEELLLCIPRNLIVMRDHNRFSGILEQPEQIRT